MNTTKHTSHENLSHETHEKHHRHSHAQVSRHAEGHHLLQVEGLSIGFEMYERNTSFFRARKKETRVIEDLHLSVHFGEIVALVGASGSGKTLLADAIMGLYEPNVRVEGTIWFDGKQQTAESLSLLRGRGISLVPQSISHLNPLMKVGKQIRGFAQHSDNEKRTIKQRKLFEQYGLGDEVANLYPHELSGGMARRVLLISALMDDPKLIVADEPTPGLDLELAIKAMQDFRNFADLGKGVLLITHDIELALKVADRVAVFNDGTVVEETAVANFEKPELLHHQFSKRLWHALPEHDFAVIPQ